MNLIKSQWKIVERAVKTKDGKDAVAFVALLVVDEKIVSANVIGFKLVDGAIGQNASLRLCSGCRAKSAKPVSRNKFAKVASPYFDAFTFLVSQPTRAPSFVN